MPVFLPIFLFLVIAVLVQARAGQQEVKSSSCIPDALGIPTAGGRKGALFLVDSGKKKHMILWGCPPTKLSPISLHLFFRVVFYLPWQMPLHVLWLKQCLCKGCVALAVLFFVHWSCPALVSPPENFSEHQSFEGKVWNQCIFIR